MNNREVLFKTKGGHAQGMGDVTSSLALALEFRNRGFRVQFIINNDSKSKELIAANGFGYAVAEKTTDLIRYLQGRNFDIVILNQLNTAIGQARTLKAHSKLLVTIEDVGKSVALADMHFNVLYPILGALTDFKYIPLSEVFQNKHRIKKKILSCVKNIIITQGGSDTYGFTPKIVRALYDIPASVTVSVIIGPNFKHDVALNSILRDAPREFTVIRGLTDLTGVMMNADLAVSAGGNTLFELACIGVPSIVICAENFEVITANRLQKNRFGVNLGFGRTVSKLKIFEAVSGLMNDFQRRRVMAAAGRSLVDGQGIKRIIQEIVSRGA